MVLGTGLDEACTDTKTDVDDTSCAGDSSTGTVVTGPSRGIVGLLAGTGAWSVMISSGVVVSGTMVLHVALGVVGAREFGGVVRAGDVISSGCGLATEG